MFRSILNTAAEAARRIGPVEAAATTTAAMSDTKTIITRSVTKSRVVRTSAFHFFQVVCNVGEYSEFLPFCTHSQILRYSPYSPQTMFDAVLTIGYLPFFTETYVSRVTIQQSELPWTVQTKSIQSTIVHSISSTWKVSPAPILSLSAHHPNAPRLPQSHNEKSKEDQFQCCNVELHVEMQVTDPFITSVLDQVLEQVASRQVEAFETRAYTTVASPTTKDREIH
jgi:coenzyme Q-binding protein COQ10